MVGKRLAPSLYYDTDLTTLYAYYVFKRACENIQYHYRVSSASHNRIAARMRFSITELKYQEASCNTSVLNYDLFVLPPGYLVNDP